MGGEGRLIFFFGTVEVGWKKECSRAKDTPSLDYIVASILERCVLSTEEREIIRERKIISTVLLCVKSANRLFESQPFQLARNITPLFCSKR